MTETDGSAVDPNDPGERDAEVARPAEPVAAEVPPTEAGPGDTAPGDDAAAEAVPTEGGPAAAAALEAPPDGAPAGGPAPTAAVPTAAVPAAPAGSPAPEPPRLAGPVGAREILWRGFDLNLAAATDVRRAAILIGLLALAAGGPALAALYALGSQIGDVNDPLDVRRALSSAQGPTGLVILVILLAVPIIIALSIDAQLLAVDVIARKATGRSFVLRSSLELVRMRFWRLLRANFLIGVILAIPNWLIEQVIAPRGVVRESQFVAVTLAGIVLSIPFAYVAASILLGQVGARESVRRSWRLARARPALALVIATVNTAFQTIALFALGAGAEILFRVSDMLGLGKATGLGLIPLWLVIALGIAAAGSLVMTIAALTGAPQVVAFLRLTGYADGLDALRDPDNPFATPRVEPLVTRPMQIALLVELALAILVVVQLA